MHSLLSRITLALTLSMPLACVEPEASEPETLVEPDVAYPTDQGHYTVELTPEDAAAWPPSAGITRFTMKILVDPDPGPMGPDLSVDVDPPTRWPDGDLTAAPAQIERIGADWMLTLDFTAGGIWGVPVTVGGVVDDQVTLYFKVREP